MAVLRQPAPETGAAVAVLAEVGEAELDGALSSMELPGRTLARLKDGKHDCAERLAFVTLSRPAGRPPAVVRVRSGQYFSPPFRLGDIPLRVAIPFPAPYLSGRGEISVLGALPGLAVALTPRWQVDSADSAAVHAVSWRPGAECARP